jgi:flavin-dependent dehydrogenase
MMKSGGASMKTESGGDFDVVIVGARVAGSAAAIMLARAGVRVLLLDKSSFPSDTISTHIVLAGGAAVLARMGALEHLEKAGGFRFARMRTTGPGFDFSSDLRRDGDDLRGICLGRERMDAVMVDLARSFDLVTLCTSFRVTDLIVEDGAIGGVRGEGSDGTREFRAPLVIGADGMRSTVARIARERLGAFSRVDTPCARVYYYAYYEGVRADRLGDELVTEFEASPGSGNLVCRCEDGLVVAAAAFDANGMRSFRAAPAANLKRQLDGSLAVGRMLEGGMISGKVRSSGLLLNTYCDPVANGALLLGDSGLHVDPLFGQGHSMALISAEIACEMAPRWLSSSRGASIDAETMKEFTTRRDAALMPHFKASERASRELMLSAAAMAAYRAASREQWAADEMVRFAQMATAKFPSFRFARLMAEHARAA